MERIYRTNLENITDEKLEKLRNQYRQNPMSLLEVDENDAKHLDDKLKTFLQDSLNPGLDGYALGLSGGLDSSLCCTLAVEAIGKENVKGCLLPSNNISSDESIPYALKVAKKTGVRINDYERVRRDLDEQVERNLRMSEVSEDHPKYKIIRGNTFARERMAILRNEALKNNYLVLGTTNATEEWLGYATKAGDGLGGIDVEPLLTLPKTSERMYARHKGVPDEIIDKVPSAELWQGQTDEDELSQWIGSKVTYESIDRIIVGLQLGLSDKEIVKANNHPLITGEVIQRLKQINAKMRHKSELPPYANLVG